MDVCPVPPPTPSISEIGLLLNQQNMECYLHKFINRNTIKVSYSTMPNLAQRIEKNNTKLEREYYKEQTVEKGCVKKCSCPKGKKCPYGGDCLQKNTVYHAEVIEFESSEGTKKQLGVETYIGSTSSTFKIRFL